MILIKPLLRSKINKSVVKTHFLVLQFEQLCDWLALLIQN